MMRTKFFISTILALSLAVFASTAWADLMPAASGWQDITVFDGQSKSGNNGWYGTREDNEVEWGTRPSGNIGGAAKSQKFDLEAMYYNPDAKQLMIIGGFDFSKFPVDHNGNKIKPGDIFLTAGSENYVLDISYPVGGAGTQTSTNYTTTYNLYSGNFATLATNYIVSSPDYKRRSGGNLEGTGNVAFFSDIYNQNSVWNGITNTFAGDSRYNKHHALVVDLEWLTEGSFEAYNTMQCGNDVIRGGASTSSVPEPASFFLFGTGLLFFAHRCRKE